MPTVGERRAALVLFLILCFAIVSISEIGIVKAESTIYIRADGIVEGTDKIQRNGDVYTFTDNINGSIVVDRDNVVVDGGGYSLVGTGGSGIHVKRRNNVTVRNVEISGFGYGIYFLGCYNNSIIGNKITDNTDGLELHYCFNNTICENVVSNSSSYGIFLIDGDQNRIYGNSFVNNSIQVHGILSSNIWDDGSKGNYWSDYEDRYPNATELDGSGIWDTPYGIYEYNQDNYPIIPEFPSWIILPIFVTATLFALIIKKRLFHPRS